MRIHRRSFIYLLITILAASLILLLSETPKAPEKEVIRIHFINVGYGDSILLELPQDEIILIDAGPKEYAASLLHYLSRLDIDEIDKAIITHPHQNHFEGFFAILDKIPIDQVFVNGDPNAEEGYAALMAEFANLHTPLNRLQRGDSMPDLPHNVEILALNPASITPNANNNAIVLFLRFKNFYALFLSDIGPEIQDDILNKFPAITKARLVQFPHHGGTISEKLAQSVQGAIFVISTGTNPWGLPKNEDLQKINEPLYRTDQDGIVVFESNGKALKSIRISNE